MASYPADYGSDDDVLHRLDINLITGANGVMKASRGLESLDCFKQSILYLLESDKKAVDTIMLYKTKIFATKGREAAKIENFLDKYLIRQYFKRSDQMLQLCEGELPDFIRKANDVVSCIEDVKREGKMLEKLNQAKNSYDCSAKVIVAKVVSLHKQHVDMLNDLKAEFKKLGRKLRNSSTLRKVLNVISIGILSVVFACGIIAAVLAIPGVAPAVTSHPGVVAFIAATSIAQTSSSAIKVGEHWLLSVIQDSESTLKARQNLYGSMVSGTKDAITVLNDIMSHVQKVIEAGNAPELFAAGGPVDLFKKEIEELDKTRKESIPVIENARKKVGEEYEKLKNMLVFRSKIK